MVLSALGFGYALFGRRPLPQPATGLTQGVASGESTEAIPSRFGSVQEEDLDESDSEGGPIRGRRARDVTITPAVRARSTLLLALTVIGIAAIIGVVLSVVLVGVVFLVT
ncbi:unannotated protein [freshwater metagenome]|uniref:Unannotated protein n=1 Tax=freshwater metagenome TaxID=449393 RepID=A0A6J6P587_9ZZZZ